MKKLSFDELMQLYKDDPEEAETYRCAVIEGAIRNMPDRMQLKARAFQARLENDLSKRKDPIAKMHLLGDRMWESFMELDEVLQDLIPQLNEKLLDSDPESSI